MLINDLPVISRKNQRTKKVRGLMRKVRYACNKYRDYPKLIKNGWCNYAHIHLDWDGYGGYSRKIRQMFIKEYAKRFKDFVDMLKSRNIEFQMFIVIHPWDSGSDCIYFHTPNPYSDFPIVLADVIWEKIGKENLFSSLLPEYTIIEGRSKDGNSLFYYAQEVGLPLE